MPKLLTNGRDKGVFMWGRGAPDAVPHCTALMSGLVWAKASHALALAVGANAFSDIHHLINMILA